MPNLSNNLVLSRCPHCSIANPNLHVVHQLETNNHEANFERVWAVYLCGSCGGLVTAWSSGWGRNVFAYYPTSLSVNEDIPERPQAYLQQALESLHTPAGAVMLAASAVDSMLKIKGYVDGSLYARIEKAADDHLITKDMATWAHEVRLDANDQRHADEEASLPLPKDAKRVVDFALALAELLFVLPSQVQRGIDQANDGD